MEKIFGLLVFLVLSLALLPINLNAQLVGESAYLIGDFVEIGINEGGHEGAPLLVGSNNRSNAAVDAPTYFGFVANPQMDGWDDFNGDFFSPGTPENGFGVEIDGVNYGNNGSGLLEEIEGSITSYEVTGECMLVIWEGSIGDIDVQVIYRLKSSSLYYLTEVNITNTGGGTYSDIYYYRNIDPDNNVTLSLDYATTNTIVQQPSPECEKALVTATQTEPWDSYIGLGAIGENFRVAHGGFANRNASEIWNGVGFSSTEGDVVTEDEAISLAYWIEELGPGETHSLEFAVILDEGSLDEAISVLFFIDFEGVEDDVIGCVPSVDTASFCEGGSIELDLAGPNIDDFIWTWTPVVGLSELIGTSTIASPDVTTVYTVEGTPLMGCIDGGIEKSIFVEVVSEPIVFIEDPGMICDLEFDLTTLVVTDADGNLDIGVKFYSIIPDSSDQVVGLWPDDLISEGESVFVVVYSNSAGCFDAEPFEIDFGTVANAGPDNAYDLCNSLDETIDLDVLLTEADLGGVWDDLDDSGAMDPITAVFDGAEVLPGDYNFRYIVDSGICGSDTAFVIITVLPEPEIDAGPDLTICEGDIAIVSGAGGIVYLWDGGVIDGLPFLPETTTTYTVSGMDLEGCFGTDELTITVNPTPTVNAGPDQVLCEGETVVLTASGADIFDWSDGVIDGASFIPEDGVTTYTVTGTSAAGCTALDEVIVTVNALPEIIAADDIVICDGTAIVLAAIGADDLTWDAGVVDGVSFIPTETSTYTVTGIDENGCTGEDEITVTVAVVPDISFTADNLIGCYPMDVTFTNTTPDVTTECKWTIGNDIFFGCLMPSYTFNSAGCHDVNLEVTTAEGCQTSRTYFDYICLDEYPIAAFYPSPSELNSNDPYTLMVNNSIGAETFGWDFGDGSSISHEENPDHTYPVDEGGVYTVTLTAESQNGCIDKTSYTVNVTEEILYYIPNTFTPDGDSFNEVFTPIFGSGLDIYDYHLVIFNRWGETVFESYNVLEGWDGTYGDGGIVDDGIYIWKIEFGDVNSDRRHEDNGHVSILK